MAERAIGALILIVSLLVAIVYAIWLLALAGVDLLGMALIIETSPWAIRLPVILLVYAFLFIVAWIGYTMATTPVPAPLEKPLEVKPATTEEKPKK